MNLSLCPICGKLSEEEQTALFSSLDYSTRSFKKGDWVARQGDALSSLYLLSKGRVKTEMIDHRKRDNSGSGDFIGAYSFGLRIFVCGK